MLYVLRRLFIKGLINISSHGWSIISILILILYISGYFLMALSGETEVVDNYTWWFVVTITTVGYGDFSPASMGGRLVAIIIMVFGIGAIALIIGKIAEWVIMMSEKQNNGSLQLKVSNHILVMGYRGEKTKKLIQEILADMGNDNTKIVLCSSTIESNPFDQERVKFVRGELASEDLLGRACCAQADKIIITGQDDDHTFFTAFAIRQINSHAQLVAFMQQKEHMRKIECLPADQQELNQTILPTAVNLIVQEIQDPYSSHVLQQIMSNLNGATLYRLDIPSHIQQNWEFGELFLKLRSQFNATVLAAKTNELITNPPMDMSISGGNSLFYIADRRLKALDWENLR